MSLLNLPTWKTITAKNNWIGSPYEPLKSLEIRARGSKFEQLTCDILSNNNHTIAPSKGTQSDMLIDGNPDEIKGSMINKAGKFVINQIRPKQTYKNIWMLLIFFDHWELWKAPKSSYTTPNQVEGLEAQHAQNPDTLIYNFEGEPQNAIKMYEGTK